MKGRVKREGCTVQFAATVVGRRVHRWALSFTVIALTMLFCVVMQVTRISDSPICQNYYSK